MDDVFISDNFLLQNDSAVELYHTYAKDQPIIDYHSHLPPVQIADNKKYANLAQIWLYGDHYKWRQMRTNGIDERFCTGNASDWEKFEAWAKTVPHTLKNPLYHWTHLELKRPFGISDRLLDPQTAPGIWKECNEKLASDDFSVRGILKQMNVEILCTTDDPTDTLENHQKIKNDTSFSVKVFPTFRPDKAMAVENPSSYNKWINLLEQRTDMTISNIEQLLEALLKRHDFFHSLGCRLSDHGLETAYAEEYSHSEIAAVFEKVRSGKQPDSKEIVKFKSAMLYEFGKMDCEKNWTQQMHLGALRNNNTRLFNKLGPDTGFDSIGDFEIARPLSRLLDRLDMENKLPRTILYNLNPRDNELLATMIGNFQDGSVPGKMQFGSGWWFLDQKSGIEAHIDALSNLSLLSRFVGMLTDSRSFLSFPRHEYFRRIVCNILGTDMELGLLPRDMNLIGNLVQDISCRNARSYFGFPES
ncbi:MAG: glucuronate isomerase [Chitinivibrionales bacterium]|nr:glucuronate isomerase [Chitinivibrionales bacterium]